MRRHLRALIGLALWTVAGCRAGGPLVPSVRYGETACDRCRMIINEARFAAAFLNGLGEWRRFDDVGCLVLHRRERPEEVRRLWVHAYQGEGWLDVDEAFFVYSSDLVTPMGYGLVAVATEEEARQLVETVGGRSVSFDELDAVLATTQGSSQTPSATFR